MKVFAICCVVLLALMAVQPIAAICQGKQSWPELVGTKGKTAAATIDKENTHVTAVLCPPLTTLAACRTFDFRCDRVRVLINRIGGVVTKTPTVG